MEEIYKMSNLDLELQRQDNVNSLVFKMGRNIEETYGIEIPSLGAIQNSLRYLLTLSDHKVAIEQLLSGIEETLSEDNFFKDPYFSEDLSRTKIMMSFNSMLRTSILDTKKILENMNKNGIDSSGW